MSLGSTHSKIRSPAMLRTHSLRPASNQRREVSGNMIPAILMQQRINQSVGVRCLGQYIVSASVIALALALALALVIALALALAHVLALDLSLRLLPAAGCCCPTLAVPALALTSRVRTIPPKVAPLVALATRLALAMVAACKPTL